MRKFFTICAVAGMIMAASSAANASLSFWMDPGDLDDMTMVSSIPESGVGSANPGVWVTPPGLPPGRVAFNYWGRLPDAATCSGSWREVQIGYRGASTQEASMNGHGYPDLSLYGDFRMSVHSQVFEMYQRDLPIKVNIWINTGYTDEGETATFSQIPWQDNLGGWTVLWDGNWIDLVLDFDNASVWQGCQETLESVPYLNHVTGIGFSVAYDGPLDDVDVYSVAVDTTTIPEPATFLVWSLLGMASWLGMRVWRRRIPVGRQPWSNENRAAIHDIINGR